MSWQLGQWYLATLGDNHSPASVMGSCPEALINGLEQWNSSYRFSIPDMGSFFNFILGTIF
jgi:hypothetical protein